MVLLNLKKISNRDLTINRYDQQIRFCDIIDLKASDVVKKFAIDKGWRSCFLAEDEFCVYYLLQNSSQFESLKKIGKALVRNLKRFSRDKSINLN